MTQPTFSPAAIDLADLMDGWYGCASQAFYFLAEEMLVDPANAKAFAQVRHEDDDARHNPTWRDEMPSREAIDIADETFTAFVEGGVFLEQTLEVDDFPALRTVLPTGNREVAARLVIEAVEARRAQAAA